MGSYQLTGRLGEGGQGTVYLGESASGERVAVKLLHPWLIGDARARARFAGELGHAKRVMPFCTARVLDADADGDVPYIVSEFIDGPSLAEVLTKNGPTTGVALDRLAIGTITALTAIHEAGIVHRDFKPGNVIIASDGPRVIDFGIARALDMTGTLTNASVGTPAYMAPEQFSGRPVGPPADVFAWACTMAFAANGRPPHGDDSVPAVMNRIVNQPPDLGTMSGPLGEIAVRCLAKDPAARPTARQILLRLLGGAEEAATPATPATPPVPPAAPQNLLNQGAQVAAAAPPPQAYPPHAYTPQAPPPHAPPRHAPPPHVPSPSPYPAPYQPVAGSTPAAGPYGAGSSRGQGVKIGLLIAGGVTVIALLLIVVVVSLSSDRDGRKQTTSPVAGTSTTAAGRSQSASPVGAGRHDVIAADTAGGWPRDPAGERELASTINSQKSTLRNATGGRLTKVVSGFYKDENATSSNGLPAGVIFLGGTGPLGDPAAFVSSFRSAASASGTVTEVDPGAGGGRAVCADARAGSTTIAFCAWATTDSFGEIVSTTPGRSVGSVAAQMRRMRPDLEHVT
ncbi:MAG TPA: serine/threonine-protein kinase [Streptosporangiaceae bacterium]|nr:serine/threonine-protein kinase [Streptosporangiaceae bacterium]